MVNQKQIHPLTLENIHRLNQQNGNTDADSEQQSLLKIYSYQLHDLRIIAHLINIKLDNHYNNKFIHFMHQFCSYTILNVRSS